jgi:hypothetical protein
VSAVTSLPNENRQSTDIQRSSIWQYIGLGPGPIEDTLRETDLSPETQRLIRKALGRTRLHPAHQRRQAVQDLVAYFQDGLARGRTAQELAEAFGQPKTVAARFFRTADRRRVFLLKAFLFVLTPLSLYELAQGVWFAILMLLISGGAASPTQNYWMEYNAPALAAQESEKAWPLYRAGIMALRGTSGECLRDEFPTERADDSQIIAVLRENEHALDLLRHAAARPHLGYFYTPNFDDELYAEYSRFVGERFARSTDETTPTISVADNPPIAKLDITYLRMLRLATRLLCHNAVYALEQGHPNDALSDLRAALRTAHHARDQFPLADYQHWATGNLQYVNVVLQELLAEQPGAFSTAQWTELSHALGAVSGGGRIRADLRSRRHAVDDLFQRIYTADGYPVPNLLHAFSTATGCSGEDEIRRGFWALSASAYFAMVSPSRAELRAIHEGVLTRTETFAARPLWLRTLDSSEFWWPDFWLDDRQGLVRYMPLISLYPGSTLVPHSLELTTQRRDATLTAIALELYRRDHGDWPATLDQLVPELLPAVPLDRFDGRPLKYTLIDGKPLLYSVGVDRDDDGGRLIAPSGEPDDTPTRRNRRANDWVPPDDIKAMRRNEKEKTYDGDWILWPRVKDPPEDSEQP